MINGLHLIEGMKNMRVHRREFIRLSGSAIAATQIPAAWAAAASKGSSAQWIWFPGQLAAYRHSRLLLKNSASPDIGLLA